jgi:hypothetical protein
MLSLRKTIPKPHLKKSRGSWLDLAPYFPENRSCLAAFLALETAEVLAGMKPANLIRINNRRKPCGRNLYHLWHAFGASLLRNSALKVLTLQNTKDAELLLFYAPNLLKRQLRKQGVPNFLKTQGYPCSTNLQKTLQELQRRFLLNADLPHEIGIFLGYPLKDVAGFINRENQPSTGGKLWRFYGDPAPSLALCNRFAACRNRMAERLQSSGNPLMLLQPLPEQIFAKRTRSD